jgi:hypothetical protein
MSRSNLLAASLLVLTAVSSVQAQSPAPTAAKPVDPPPTTAAGSPRTRAQVTAEVERAMRDGTWRCATTNRGWCGTTPQDGPPARNPRG